MVIGGGALATSKLWGKGNGNEASTTEKLRNEDGISGLSDVETGAESEKVGKKDDDVNKDKADVENKSAGKISE